MKKICSLILILFPLWMMANDSIQGKATIYGTDLYIGEKLYLEVEVMAPKSVDLQLPEKAPEIKGLEAFGNPGPTEQIDHVHSNIYKKRYPYIAFDSVAGSTGEIPIPYTEQDKQKTLTIQGVSFQVQRIPIDTTDALRAAYGPMGAVSHTDWNAFIWIAIVALALGGVIAFFQWRKNRKKLSIPLDADPREWALEQLKLLETQIPFTRQKDAWSQLTDIVRLYMERSWEVPAPYFSTGEVLGAIASKEAYSSQVAQVSDVLEISDQIKFARKTSTEEEQKQAIQTAREIIRFQPGSTMTVVKEEVGNG